MTKNRKIEKRHRFLMLIVVNVIAILGLNGCGSLHFGPTTNNISKKWSYLTGGGIDSSPAIGSDGTIYVVSKNNKLYAVNSNGKLKWSYNGGLDWTSYTGGGELEPSPAIGPDGTIYISIVNGDTPINIISGNAVYSGINKLFAINPYGMLKWELPVGGILAIAGDGTIYVSSLGFTTAKSDGTIYTSTAGLYAINPTGGFNWSYTTENLEVYGMSPPIIGTDGTIYVNSGNNVLYAINPTGALKWSSSTIGGVLSAVDASDTIYLTSSTSTGFFGSISGELYVINPNSGLQWTYPTGTSIYSSPAIGVDGTIYLSSGGTLYAINPNATRKWVVGICHTLLGCSSDDSSPAIGADGTIYVGSWDGALYAINPNGTMKGSYVMGGNINSSPAIGADGTIYIGSTNGYLYALTMNDKGGTTGLAHSAWPMFRAGPMHSGRVYGP